MNVGLEEVAAAVAEAPRILATTHELPDGDSLGSALALCRAVHARGGDALCFVSGDTPLPDELGYLEPVEVVRRLPADAGERVAVVMDCGTLERIGEPALRGAVPTLVNVDHHHDNRRFGDLNWVDESAAATAQMVYELIRRLNVPITRDIAEPLYAGLVTDTGRFSYDNTTAESLVVAADLVRAGVEPQRAFRCIYEDVPAAKLRLLSRAIDHMRILEGGRVVVSELTRDDFAVAGAKDAHAEGIIDHLRSLRGVAMCALIREPTNGGDPRRRVSMRATSPRWDVSAVAHEMGGGGHPQAAGFSADISVDDLGAMLLSVLRSHPS